MMMDSLTDFFEEAIRKATGQSVKINHSQRLSGGDINLAAKLETTSGVFCIKWQETEYPGMFQKEANGLKILKEAKAIGVPEPIGFGKALGMYFILLEYINAASRISYFWEDFGHALASLHQCSSTSHGLHEDNYIGSLPQPNKQTESWTDFFIKHRLQYQVELGIRKGSIPATVADDFEKLYPALSNILPSEAASLIHGDLWSGNFMTGPDGKAWIYDPATHYAHREMDLAFTRLFGGYDRAFYEAYNESFPLLSGAEDRLSLYQLYPLLVHVNLFGGRYLNSVVNILNRFI